MSAVEEGPISVGGEASTSQLKKDVEKPQQNGESLSNGDKPKVDSPGKDKNSEDEKEKKTEAEEEVDDKTPVGSLCEIMSLVRRTKESGEEETVERTKPKSKSKYAKYAVVSKQIFDNKGKLEKTNIEINSPQLLKALRDTVKFYPAEPLTFDDHAKFDSPFMLLNHYLEDLEQYAERSDDEDVKSHIKLLREVLDTEAADEATEARKQIDSGLIHYKSLWRLFRPGELFYEEEYGYARVYILHKAGYGEHPRNGPFFEASVMYTAHDSTRAGQVIEKIRMYEHDYFVGGSATKISSLKLYPLSYIPEKDDLLEHLGERGKRYLEIGSHGLFEYDGLYQYLKPPPEDYYSECDTLAGRWLPLTGSGRVFIDAKTFAEEKKDSEQSVWSRLVRKMDNDTDDDNQAFESLEVDPKLCPPFAFGYNFDTKHWCKFYVENLSEVRWTPNAMDQLIISPQQKRLITSLVTAHEFPERSRNEAQLKGKGLIMLLHGTPGSGKTLTAELSAEATKRPLIKISTGELGSYGSRITSELRKMLGYASTWHAIVLIDEADVFLESRSTSSAGGASADKLEHNNLVAVFLRQLEYFQGILFLTSNRVGVFDPAIRSRLHLAVQYLSPDRERREALWRNGLLKEQQQAAAVTSSSSEEDLENTAKALSEAEMNGREIANSINTAKTLAKGEGKPLGKDHIETVVGVWEEFQQAVKLGAEWSA